MYATTRAIHSLSMAAVLETKKEVKEPTEESFEKPVEEPLQKRPVMVEQNPLQSQLKAFEGEILNLRADKQMLEQDKQELEDAIEKFKSGVRSSEETVEAMKTENQTLKMEIKGHLSENIAIQKKLEKLLATVSTLKQQLDESKTAEKKAVALVSGLREEADSSKRTSTAQMKELQDKHAMEIGKAKREHLEEKEQLLLVQSKKLHESESFYRQSKVELQESLTELRETVANQATRIMTYEKKIEQLDLENQRLRIQGQLRARNKLTVSQQQEIENMKLQSDQQQEDINRLKVALDLIHVNQHFDDFRGLGGN